MKRMMIAVGNDAECLPVLQT